MPTSTVAPTGASGRSCSLLRCILRVFSLLPCLLLAVLCAPPTRAAVEYEVVEFQDLGTLGIEGGVFPYGLNEVGDVVGTSHDSVIGTRAFLWRNGVMTSLPLSGAYDINEAGEIVGELELPRFFPFPGEPGHVGFHPNRPARYHNGSVTNLGTFDSDDLWSDGWAAAINNDGVVVGLADAGLDQDFVHTNSRAFRHAGALAAIAEFSLAPGEYSGANDINNAGAIVGEARNSEGRMRALLRTPDGTVIDITPGPEDSAAAEAINEVGDVLCRYGLSAYVRRADGSTYPLPTPAAYVRLEASDINDARHVVGVTRLEDDPGDADPYPEFFAFFADESTYVDLNALAARFLAPPGQPGFVRLKEAQAINNSNQIVGAGIYRDHEGNEYWVRGFRLTIARKPPALIVHDVGIHGDAGPALAGVTVRLTLGSEVFATMLSDESGRATFPFGVDLDAVYNVELEKSLVVEGQAPILVRRSLGLLKPSEIADDQVTVQFPETLVRHLETKLRVLESPGALITPFETTALRSLLADWIDLQPETLQLHAERDLALARLLAATESLALFLAEVTTLNTETATIIGKTLTSLLAFAHAQRELGSKLAEQLAAQEAKELIVHEAAIIAYALIVTASEQGAKKAAEAFSSGLKAVVPATAADVVNEALNVTIKGVVSVLADEAWEKRKGIEGARKELLEDAAEKVIGEVGGRLLTSHFVSSTQDDLALAETRTRNFSFSGTSFEARSASPGTAVFLIETQVRTRFDELHTVAGTVDEFEVVADFADIVGSLAKLKAVTMAAHFIKGINLVGVTAASARGVDMLLEVSDTYAPDTVQAAHFPGGSSGGGGTAKPGRTTASRIPASITADYGSALAAVAAALPAGDLPTLTAALSALLAEEAELDVVCSDIAERLALLARQSAPPAPGLVDAAAGFANARLRLTAERALLYPLLAGVLAPLLADPDVVLADIQAQISVVQGELAALDAAASWAADSSLGLVAPATVVLLGHGLPEGALTVQAGAVRLQARVINPGDAPLTDLTVTLSPEAETAPVARLRVVSPASIAVPELGAGQSLVLSWDVVATDTSSTGTGSLAGYRLVGVVAGTSAIDARGSFGVQPAGGRFAEWSSERLPAGAPAGFLEDADGDGVPNGLERFHATAPGTPDASGMELLAGPSGPTLRHTRAAERGFDTKAFYEWSRDLSTWQASGAAAGGVSVLLEPVVVAGEGSADQVVEIVPQVTGAAPALFYRLRLEQDSAEPPPPAALAAPVIVTQPPDSQVVEYGAPFTLTVAATGSAPLLYQWSLNGVVIPGISGPSHTVPFAEGHHAGFYRVAVIGLGGTVESSPFEVIIGGGGGG